MTHVLMLDGYRIASDERNARNRPVLSSWNWSTSWQGGFELMAVTIRRALGDVEGITQGARAQVLGRGGRVLWEGYLSQVARNVDGMGHEEIRLSAIGYQNLLKARTDAKWIGVLRGADWQGPSLDLQDAIWSLYVRTPSGPDASGGTMTFAVDADRSWSADQGRPHIVATYDAGPLRIGRMGFEHQQLDGLAGVAAGGTWQAGAQVDTGWASADLISATAGWRSLDSGPLTPSQLAHIQLYANPSTGGTGNSKIRFEVKNPVLVGTHGLPLTGSGPADWGIKMSDAVPHWLRTFCPQIVPGKIVDSVTGIQNLAFLEGGSSIDEWIAHANGHHAYGWGVWEDRRLDMGPWGSTGRTWVVDAGSPGVQLQDDGMDLATQLCTDLVIEFEGPDGPRTIGGPGTVCHEESELLTVTDSRHPLRAAGIRRVATWKVDAPLDDVEAVAVGQRIMGHINQAARAGQVILAGNLVDDRGARGSAHDVRAGDEVIVTRAGDDAPRRIVKTQASYDGRATACTIDNTRQAATAMLAHVSSRLTGRG